METEHKPFWPIIQLALSNSPFEIAYKGSVGDYMESLAKLKVDNIVCFPLFVRWSHLITRDNEIGLVWFTLVNPCWLFQITFSFMCLENFCQDGSLHDSSVFP